MIKKYDVGGPWNDIFGDENNNSSDYIKLTNPDAKLSKAGDINLRNMWDNVNIINHKLNFKDRFSRRFSAMYGQLSNLGK
jgi:hypothetical protein